MTELDDCIKELKESPLYQMTSSSMENSHSDFWCWMLNKFGTEILSIFTTPYADETIEEVHRELHHFDLYIKTNKRFIILENKMKSFYNIEQIKNYSEKLKKQKEIISPLCLIITYFQDDINIKDTNWKHLTYESIYNKLNSITNQNLYINEYKNVLNNLLIIKNKMNELNKNIYENGLSDFCTKLKEIRINDIYQKYKASELKNYLQEKLKDNNNLSFEEYFISGNGVTTVCFNKNGFIYYIQLQGSKYYRTIEKQDMQTKIGQDEETWCYLDEEEKNASDMKDKDKFNTFEKGKYICRHFNINKYFNKQDVSYDDLLNKIKCDLNEKCNP